MRRKCVPPRGRISCVVYEPLRRCTYICRTDTWDNQNHAFYHIWGTAFAVSLPLHRLLKRIQVFCIWSSCRCQLPLILRTNWEDHQESTPFAPTVVSLSVCDSFVCHNASSLCYGPYIRSFNELKLDKIALLYIGKYYSPIMYIGVRTITLNPVIS